MNIDLETFIEYEFKPLREELVGKNIHPDDKGWVGLLEKKMEKVDRLTDTLLGVKGWVALFGGFVMFWLVVLTTLKTMGWWPK